MTSTYKELLEIKKKRIADIIRGAENDLQAVKDDCNKRIKVVKEKSRQAKMDAIRAKLGI